MKLLIQNLILLVTTIYLFSDHTYSADYPSIYGHSSVLVNDKLFIFGGNTYSGDLSQCIYCLDATDPRQSLSQPPINLTTDLNYTIKIAWATAVTYNSTIFLYGGKIQSIDAPANLYIFDSINLTWNDPYVPQNESRISMQAVIDSKGKIYIFGGYHVPQFLSGSFPPSITIFNNMIVINTILSKNHLIVNTTSGIMGRAYYSATMLDDSIFYIGGIDSSYRSVKISNIITYNTSSNQWANINVDFTDSEIIENRYGHTAVLSQTTNRVISSTKSYNKMYLFDISASTWVPITPTPSLGLTIVSVIICVIIIIASLVILIYNKDRLRRIIDENFRRERMNIAISDAPIN
ncbi:5975_t:CDS:2 [Acaulospora morrowiae]|uniref:5975_t:CDS:1 n=1 Tax=Acaulospora morrowiae TaxID=94023 RepID=A0A9N9F4G0_9GLOM|nr:5975_t:CDS:2 [Acaulospora morrowiae]